MRVHLGSDHAGLDLKTAIAARLRALGHEPVDHGPETFDPEDDYPTYCLRAAEGVVSDTSAGALAIVIGGSGNGEAIAANKVKGTRCALAHSDETARLARQHNDANVMSLGARMTAEVDALRFVEIFVTTPFSGDARHARRIAQLAEYEKTGKLPEVRRAP
ncbi:MAG: ribose 5-phosphate isomerase [Myxococcales bacterium]|nr:ribose 5-phosphate isomerase [Myxococcales bacterium]